MTEADYNQLKEIHEKHYKNEFSFPDFSRKYLNLWSVFSDDDRLVCSGGIRTIIESVIITDKDINRATRVKALQLMHQATEHFTNCAGYDEFHVFIQDPNYERQLIKSGFNPTNGKCLVYGVR